ncbi:class II aldolase/adducin family protein [Falsiroseomonas selenitidurans]|uniref:Class II aldolase/adducin family protein n=1 Tax=Falsiroseomonas selenitidurans TaxID=2716335 RepID=A0ABX1E650_9PROT|nr:class II aldolase/adducin family protein [Falsiroseomonas selenitidurans]NKC32660.1 class II aldolase/adducin family protein [Falsiroseomonas selenitidurans]
MSDAVAHAIRELVLANRILAREEVIDDFGHISLRHPERPDRYFLSRSRSPVAVTADDIMEFELDGTPVAQNGRRMYSERALHSAILMARPEVMSVVHHHARSVIPFTVVRSLVLKPIFHMGSVMGSEVPLWDSQPEFGDTNMLIDDLPRGHSLARALGPNRSVMLRGHGACNVGVTLRAAVFTAVYMKHNAEMVLASIPHGTPEYLTPGEVEKTATMLLSDMPLARAWDYWITRAGYGGV